MKRNEKISSFQLFEQEVQKDELHSWYMEKDPQVANQQVAQTEEVVEKNKSSSSKEKDDELSTKEMLKILMQSQERTMQIALKATVSPSKEEAVVDTSLKELERDWSEDQRMKVVDLEELPSQLEGNAAVKCGDWIHRITPTISNLSRKASIYWQRTLEVVQGRYNKHLESTPLGRLDMEYSEEPEEKAKEYTKVRSVIAEMLLKALPKDLSAEAITKRLEDPMKILLLVMIKYQPGGRREREALLNQITNPESCWTEEQALEAVRTWKRKIERAKELKLIIPDPSIMLAALDVIAEKVLKKDQRRSFRMESIRDEIKVDVIPTYEAAE